MDRPSRARRRTHTIRVAKKRRVQARRLDSPWGERPLGHFTDEQVLGCRRALCGLCHPSKRSHRGSDRNARGRAWREDWL